MTNEIKPIVRTPPPPPPPMLRAIPDTPDLDDVEGPIIDEDAIAGSLLSALLGSDVMTKTKAMQVPAYAASVELLAGVVSELPIKLYKETEGKVDEIYDDNRVSLFNGDTGDLVRAPEMIRMFIRDYYNDKGAFIYANWQGNELKSLHYVDPSAVSVYKDSTDHIFKRAVFMVDGRAFMPWQFIYACRNARDGVTGESMVSQSEKPIATAYAALEYELALMQRGGNKRGYLKSEGKISPEAVDRLRKSFRQMYSNNNAENVVVLNRGIEFQEASETSTEMQLAENKRANSDDIMSLFLIAPALIRGGATEEDGKNFVKYALLPLLEILRTAINHAALLESEKQAGYYFDFDLKEFTKASMKDRWAAWATAKKNGLVNADEFRRFENLPPLGMNYINLGLNDVLMDPDTHEIIVPNMGAIIDPNAQPIDAKSNANTIDQAQNQPSEGGEKSGDQSK